MPRWVAAFATLTPIAPKPITPTGANANGVKELVFAGMLLASRDITGGINWVLDNQGSETVAKDAEKAKKAFAGCEICGKKLGVTGRSSYLLSLYNSHQTNQFLCWQWDLSNNTETS